uniref:Uncharacterized protein n=1 Tax=Polytomella parva TaxID=51329 RepID=A0A7S0UUA8_9CHLO|mmetsp:Transcript_18123/g.33113  ORF Transcript_18123/g.33113 Transcript_18123/m.33113 type:complete len:258 (+) Transcript_18123:198-971(+)
MSTFRQKQLQGTSASANQFSEPQFGTRDFIRITAALLLLFVLLAGFTFFLSFWLLKIKRQMLEKKDIDGASYCGEGKVFYEEMFLPSNWSLYKRLRKYVRILGAVFSGQGVDLACHSLDSNTLAAHEAQFFHVMDPKSLSSKSSFISSAMIRFPNFTYDSSAIPNSKSDISLSIHPFPLLNSHLSLPCTFTKNERQTDVPSDMDSNIYVGTYSGIRRTSKSDYGGWRNTRASSNDDWFLNWWIQNSNKEAMMDVNRL